MPNEKSSDSKQQQEEEKIENEENEQSPKGALGIWSQLIKVVGRLTGLPKRAAVAVSGVLAVFILTGKAGSSVDPLSNVVGYLYPLYATFKALKSDDKSDDTQWLTYWMVVSTISLIESFTGKLFTWLPLYSALKTLFLIWCFMPHTRGAEVIFNKFISPFLTKYESSIDNQVVKARESLSSLFLNFPASISNNSITAPNKDDNDN